MIPTGDAGNRSRWHKQRDPPKGGPLCSMEYATLTCWQSEQMRPYHDASERCGGSETTGAFKIWDHRPATAASKMTLVFPRNADLRTANVLPCKQLPTERLPLEITATDLWVLNWPALAPNAQSPRLLHSRLERPYRWRPGSTINHQTATTARLEVKTTKIPTEDYFGPTNVERTNGFEG